MDDEVEEIFLILTGEVIDNIKQVEIGYCINNETGFIKYVITLGKNNQLGAHYCLNQLKSNYYYRAKNEVTCFGVKTFEFLKIKTIIYTE